MTNEEREEALAIMNVIIHMIEKQYDNDRVEKAVDTAIAALKAESCEEDLHREREQAYMQGYEDASKRFRIEPCENATLKDILSEEGESE